jgi:hypothetical protein
MIDNRNGFGSTLEWPLFTPEDYEDLIVELNDNFIYGESAASDCPDDGSFCKPVEKYGYVMAGAQGGGKPAHVVDTSSLPYNNVQAQGSWGTKIWLKRNRFEGFSKTTREGLRQSVMQVSEHQYDYVPMNEFFDNTFVDVQDGAFIFIYDPPQKWANIDDCGDFPCTAPLNVLSSFQGSVFEG